MNTSRPARDPSVKWIMIPQEFDLQEKLPAATAWDVLVLIVALVFVAQALAGLLRRELWFGMLGSVVILIVLGSYWTLRTVTTVACGSPGLTVTTSRRARRPPSRLPVVGGHGSALRRSNERRRGHYHADSQGRDKKSLQSLSSALKTRLCHMAAIRYRMKTYRPSLIIYVVYHRHAMYVRQLFALVRALRYTPSTVELIHVGLGTVYDAKGEASSTRHGNGSQSSTGAHLPYKELQR